MSNRYYVKARGRVAGPFPVERLKEMAQQGQLSRIHNLSTDGQQWVKASSVPELFQANPAAAVAKPVAVNQSTPTPTAPSVSESGSGAIWHYGINGQSAGPVTEQVIVQLIQSGKLSATDRVWNASFDDWKSVKEVNQWAGLIPETGTGGQRSAGPRNSTLSDDDEVGYAEWSVHQREISSSLATMVPWVYFVSIFTYLFCVGLMYTCIYGLVTGYKQDSLAVVGWAVALLAGILTLVTGGIFLQRFASYGNRFTLTNDTDSLRLAIFWLKRFWLVVGISLLVAIVSSLIVYGYTVAVLNNLIQ